MEGKSHAFELMIFKILRLISDMISFIIG